MSNPDLSAVRWRKSTHSSGQGGQCVEITALPSGIAFRDSKDPGGTVLILSADDWQAVKRRIAENAPDKDRGLYESR